MVISTTISSNIITDVTILAFEIFQFLHNTQVL